jgi:hypothetical protein
MPYAPQIALRNRCLIWGSSPHRMGGSVMPGAGQSAAANAPSHRSDTGHHHCVCSDGCTGIADSPGCNGHPDADGSADTVTALDRHARDTDANCYTAYRLDAGARCCSDPGDCNEHCDV